MKEKVLEILNITRDNPIDLETIYRKSGYTNYSKEDFLNVINELVEEKKITCANSKLNLYKLNPYREGIFHIKRNGDCYVNIGDRDITINKDFTYGSMDKDKVLVKITNYDTNTGTIKEIIERNGIIAEVKTINKDRYAQVGKNMYKIELPANMVDGMLIGIKIDKSKAGKYFHATLDKVIGHKNATGIEEQKILYEQGIPFTFDANTLKEAYNLPSSVKEEDLEKRRDLRNEMIFTIDGDDTKDIDDAISIKKLESVIFDLTDSLGKKEIAKALEVLQNLIFAKEPIQKILITLYNHFKKLYFTKLSVKYNKDVISSLNLKPNQTFLVNKYKTQAKYFKESELSGILQSLRDLDFNYKNGLIDLQVGLEAILCRYCS